jgi:hypothetical protein
MLAMPMQTLTLAWHGDGACNLTIGHEYPPADEPASIAAVTANFMALGKAQVPKEIVRGAHAKTNACARATWKVDKGWVSKDLSLAGLDIGVFGDDGASLDAWVRFSNGAGNSKEGSDMDPDVRGVGIKLLGVSGAHLPAVDSETDTQDFIFISSKLNAFPNRGVKDYLVPPTPDVCPHCPINAADMGSQYQVENPINVTYGSLVNYVVEDDARTVGVKYWLEPCAGHAPFVFPSNRTNGRPDWAAGKGNAQFLRDAVTEQLDPATGAEACMQFGIQLQTDACAMPMEDASVPWSSERIPVAKLTFPLQHGVPTSRQHALCEIMHFNPWHTLAAHRPAGGLSRARKVLYPAVAGQRDKLNQCQEVHPTSVCLASSSEMLKPAAQCPFVP